MSQQFRLIQSDPDRIKGVDPNGELSLEQAFQFAIGQQSGSRKTYTINSEVTDHELYTLGHSVMRTRTTPVQVMRGGTNRTVVVIG